MSKKKEKKKKEKKVRSRSESNSTDKGVSFDTIRLKFGKQKGANDREELEIECQLISQYRTKEILH